MEIEELLEKLKELEEGHRIFVKYQLRNTASIIEEIEAVEDELKEKYLSEKRSDSNRSLTSHRVRT